RPTPGSPSLPSYGASATTSSPDSASPPRTSTFTPRTPGIPAWQLKSNSTSLAGTTTSSPAPTPPATSIGGGMYNVAAPVVPAVEDTSASGVLVEKEDAGSSTSEESKPMAEAVPEATKSEAGDQSRLEDSSRVGCASALTFADMAAVLSARQIVSYLLTDSRVTPGFGAAEALQRLTNLLLSATYIFHPTHPPHNLQRTSTPTPTPDLKSIQMFARSLRTLPRTVGHRAYATEPINASRGDSKTPLYLGGTAVVLVGAYLYANRAPEASSGGQRMQDIAGAQEQKK
ncbi:hypothetical protein P7C70_g8426, partial [Phenoliferia sp. Uapishka_3]